MESTFGYHSTFANGAEGPASSLEPTVDSYFRAFSPAPAWDELPAWPPDVFAISNLVLDHTEAYRFAVSPHGRRTWPPTTDWNQSVQTAAEKWRLVAQPGRSDLIPHQVREHWEILARHRETSLSDLRYGRAEELCSAFLTLHAMADEACRSLGTHSAESFERRAWGLMAEHGSLSRISPARIRIVPKTNFPGRGITIRSFSRYLALSYESVDLRWRRFEPTLAPLETMGDPQSFNAILLPWPFHIEGRAFRPVEGPLQNMDPEAYGFFEFAPEAPLDLSHVARLLEKAIEEVERVDALILPEAAVEPHELRPLEALLAEYGVNYLFAGVREMGEAGDLGRNYLHLGVHTGSGWECYEQTKHNRWCLDGNQIRQYHLTRALAPSKLWWEAIHLPERTVEIIDVGGSATTVPLICEDLARLDEVSDLLRRVGPTIIIAVLLDGPQLAGRWSGRYASVLADDPGSAVLTLTSYGMAARSRPPGKSPSRVVAMWNDPHTGLHELELARGASGILLTASEGMAHGWTADGRHHHTPRLALSEVRQLRVPGVGAA
ncbi:MAG TPA: hypothetical protein VF148_14915 [Acidimicrobiia bacterium]